MLSSEAQGPILPLIFVIGTVFLAVIKRMSSKRRQKTAPTPKKSMEDSAPVLYCYEC